MRHDRKYSRQTPVGFREAQVCDCGDHGFVGLTSGKVAFIDPEDVSWARSWHWKAHANRHTTYASRTYNDEGRFRCIPLHRAIMLPGDQFVDHADGDGLNNRRANLRVCSPQENSFNKRGHSSRTGIKVQKCGGFSVFCGARKFGSFVTRNDAVRFRDAIATVLSGGFSRTSSGICDGDEVVEPSRITYILDGVEFSTTGQAAHYRGVSYQRICQLVDSGRDGFGRAVRSSLSEEDRALLSQHFTLVAPSGHPKATAPAQAASREKRRAG